MLQRLFSGFPGGWPGVALLVLRVVLATALFVQGAYYLSEPDGSPATWFAGLAGLASGGLLFLGFLTPVAGAVVVLCAAGIAFSLIPTCTKTVFESFVPRVFALTNQLAIMILGPGAFSIDARLFGRREIIIPLSSSMRH